MSTKSLDRNLSNPLHMNQSFDSPSVVLRAEDLAGSAAASGLLGRTVVGLVLESSEVQETRDLLDEIGALREMLIRQRRQMRLEKFTKVVQDLTRDVVLSPSERNEAISRAHAIRHILEKEDWLTTTELGKQAGLSATNYSAQPNRWKKARKIFAVNHRGRDYFPRYALGDDLRPLPIIKEVLKVFDGYKDSWKTAFWFSSLNGFLGGDLAPRDLVAGDPANVLAAAKDEIAGVKHG